MNLNGADLTRIELNEVDLSEADMGESILRQGQLKHIDLIKANLSRAFLSGAEFVDVDLSGVNLSEADLSGANLSRACLKDADLSGTNLSRVDLSMADLAGADLSKAKLSGTNLSHITTASTIFGDVDLRQVRGLETIHHLGPSSVGVDTINRSNGEIPEVFLRGAGLSDVYLDFIRSLRARPLAYYRCFISYSSEDQAFAERLHADLTSRGIRCWFAPHDLRIGLRPLIDESIEQYDKLILVLSEHAMMSSWIESEVEATFEKERLQNQLVLFPIRLDDSVMRTSQAWAADIRRLRFIADFSSWKEDAAYQRSLRRLLRDLNAESKSSTSMAMEKLTEDAVLRWAERALSPGRQVSRAGSHDYGLDMHFIDKNGENIGIEVKFIAHPKRVRISVSSIIHSYLKNEIQPSIDKLTVVWASPEEATARVVASILPTLDDVPPTVSFVTGYIQNGEFHEIVNSPAKK